MYSEIKAKRIFHSFCHMLSQTWHLVYPLHNGLKGPNICVATACSSGSHGIGEGYLYIKTAWQI